MAFGQSFALWLSVVGEYGFAYSATRAIARMRDNRDGVSALVASVIGAKPDPGAGHGSGHFSGYALCPPPSSSSPCWPGGPWGWR